jgi:hypothetical protein
MVVIHLPDPAYSDSCFGVFQRRLLVVGQVIALGILLVRAGGLRGRVGLRRSLYLPSSELSLLACGGAFCYLGVWFCSDAEGEVSRGNVMLRLRQCQAARHQLFF